MFDSDMEQRLRQEAPLEVPADAVANGVLRLELPPDLSPVHFIRLDLTAQDGTPVADTFYWRSKDAYRGPRTSSGPLYAGFEAIKDLPLVSLQPLVRKGAREGKPRWEVRLRNAGRGLAFMVQVKLIEDGSGKPVRPSFYSDNFVSLLPGEERVITVETLSAAPPPAHIEVEGWNVPRVLARH